MKAEALYGNWTLAMPQANISGQMRLSRHPEFSESLRGNLRYGPVNAIASGDLTEGKFELDESSDGKRLTATWSGQLTASACGDEIRGKWTELDTNLSSDFVLQRIKPSAPAAPAIPSQPNPANQLPNGVRTDPVPSPGWV